MSQRTTQYDGIDYFDLGGVPRQNIYRFAIRTMVELRVTEIRYLV